MAKWETVFDRALMERIDNEPELVGQLIDTAIRMALAGHFKWWVTVADRIDALDDAMADDATATHSTENIAEPISHTRPSTTPRRAAG